MDGEYDIFGNPVAAPVVDEPFKVGDRCDATGVDQ